MAIRRLLTSSLVAAAVALSAAAEAKTFKFAFIGDAQSLDPHALNETFTLGFLGNVFDGLVKRDGDLQIQPALATSWEILDEGKRWRFNLREGVTFHNGNAFNADDVVFSAARVRADGSDLQTRIGQDVEVVKVDDYTVDFIMESPNPILHYEWETWYIMDKEWSEENNAIAPQSITEGTENFAAFNANGTGPFMVVDRQKDVKTTLTRNTDYWDTMATNVTEVIFTPIGTDATRVAALLSGEIDLAFPVPVQEMGAINDNANTQVLAGPELRTIFLGFNHIEGPTANLGVRQAMMAAINIDAIKKIVMRDLSTPSAIMISPFLFAKSGDFTRPGYDPEKAKSLLAEAGYPDGFDITMDCPNNRYVNDDDICLAAVSMLAKVGINVNLVAQPKAQYFAKVLKPKNDTDFYLLGWTPGSMDSWNILYNIEGCDDGTGRGKFNLGNYCNPAVDALTDRVLVESDPAARDELIKQAFELTTGDVSHIPLHQQGLAWGVRNGISVVQRADNQLDWDYILIED